MNKAIEKICKDYDISKDDLFTKHRYGKLPEARMVLVGAMRKSGMRNKEIEAATGFSQSRIVHLLNRSRDIEIKIKIREILPLI